MLDVAACLEIVHIQFFLVAEDEIAVSTIGDMLFLEGYDIIQEAVNSAADLETERIMQRLTWISVCSNLAPSLGLLGTVQGMIMCFATLASGVPDIGALAGNISQALWTTAGGLVVSIPALTLFYSIRNNANRLILRMTALTMELIKDLRNVEVEGGDSAQ